MRKVRGVSLRRWGVALLAALVWAPSAAAEAPIGDELAIALAGEMPAGGLRVMVSLRRGDMPVHKLERRARMRERIRGVTGGLRGGKLKTTRRFELLGGFAASLDRAEIAALRRHPMVEHVYRRCSMATVLNETYVATCDK